MHYDSELTGFAEKFDGDIFAIKCDLINSGGIPIAIREITYNLKNSKNEVLFSDKEKKLFTSKFKKHIYR